MIAAVLVTEVQRTEQAVTALIVLLLVVAALLSILTIWYWRHTSPKRRARMAQHRQMVTVDEVDLTGPPTEVYPLVNGQPPIGTQPRNLR